MNFHRPNTWYLKSSLLCRLELCRIKRLFWLNIMAWFQWTCTGFISRPSNVRVYVTLNLAGLVSPVYIAGCWSQWHMHLHTRTIHRYCAATLLQHTPILTLQSFTMLVLSWLCQFKCVDLVLKSTILVIVFRFANLFLLKVKYHTNTNPLNNSNKNSTCWSKVNVSHNNNKKDLLIKKKVMAICFVKKVRLILWFFLFV